MLADHQIRFEIENAGEHFLFLLMIQLLFSRPLLTSGWDQSSSGIEAPANRSILNTLKD